MTRAPALVLASSSPRRREILARLGLATEVVFPEVDETRRPGEAPPDLALRAAREKARAVARALADRSPPAWVIGADTVVVVDGEPLGKPEDDDDARRMLAALSGRDHEVMTGWVVLSTGGEAERAGLEVTTVRFKRLAAREIDAYVATGEGADKAGAYGIQGLGCFLVEAICGNYENVVGLPACPLVGALEALGAVETFPPPVGGHDDHR